MDKCIDYLVLFKIGLDCCELLVVSDSVPHLEHLFAFRF